MSAVACKLSESFGIKSPRQFQDVDDRHRACFAKGLENAARRNLRFRESPFAQAIQTRATTPPTVASGVKPVGVGLSHLSKVTQMSRPSSDMIGGCTQSGRRAGLRLASLLCRKKLNRKP